MLTGITHQEYLERKLVYSYKAASNMVSFKPTRLILEGQTVFIMGDDCSARVEKKKFLEYFAESRKQRAVSIKTSFPINKNKWLVWGRDEKPYQVLIVSGLYKCSCPDWKNQAIMGMERPFCKHCYHVQARKKYHSN